MGLKYSKLCFCVAIFFNRTIIGLSKERIKVMRLKIILAPVQTDCYLSFNYQYSLSSAIYNMINCADSNYAKHLHDHGMKSSDGKPLKLFTFSYLTTPFKEIRENKISALRFYKSCHRRQYILYESFVGKACCSANHL